ncbi:hypothetical protein ACJJTC_008110 [Scirpophaga incertulas]
MAYKSNKTDDDATPDISAERFDEWKGRLCEVTRGRARPAALGGEDARIATSCVRRTVPERVYVPRPRCGTCRLLTLPSNSYLNTVPKPSSSVNVNALVIFC